MLPDCGPLHSSALPTRVLIVDDNDSVRGCPQAMFMALGYLTDVAADGLEALPKLESGDYAAVICDLAMPHMTGDQLYSACQALPTDIARRFIFITGDVYGPASANLIENTAQPHLAKPFRLTDIQAALNEVAAAS